MDTEYFKRQICDELDGAKDYIMRAIEIKPMTSAWATKLMEMSAQELEHAKKLFTMWQEYYTIQTKDRMANIPDYLSESNTEITEMYLEKTACVQMMHQQMKV